MKKILERLRCWLIKKLGGFTEQVAPLQREITWSENVQRRKIQANVIVDRMVPDSGVDLKRYCERHMMETLMRELYQSGFILWERQDDVIEQKVHVRATLHMVNASDLKRVKEHFRSEIKEVTLVDMGMQVYAKVENETEV